MKKISKVDFGLISVLLSGLGLIATSIASQQNDEKMAELIANRVYELSQQKKDVE